MYKVYPDKRGRKPKVVYYILKYAGDETPERYWVQGSGDDAEALVRAAVRERLGGASPGGGEPAAPEPAGGVAPEALPRRVELHASAGRQLTDGHALRDAGGRQPRARRDGARSRLKRAILEISILAGSSLSPGKWTQPKDLAVWGPDRARERAAETMRRDTCRWTQRSGGQGSVGCRLAAPLDMCPFARAPMRPFFC